MHDINATPVPNALVKIKKFSDFYPFYLGEHQHIACRRLHFMASLCGLIGLTSAVVLHKPVLIAAGIVAGYACAWVGHFVFEKNKPASFKQPLYSFMADWCMFREMLSGKISLIDASRDRRT